jgi:hypothetical protein
MSNKGTLKMKKMWNRESGARLEQQLAAISYAENE